MREIVFRGKRIDNGEWVVGMLARYNPIYDAANIVDEREILVPVVAETVGQYTGLTDKNENKIFEGDIVVDSYCLSKNNLSNASTIKYGEWNCNCCHGVFGWTCDGNTDMRDELVVIGNIHDNPELLKGGAEE